jgi:flagellar biosynthesis protein FlhF
MSMKRFVAPTAREALNRIRSELGPDAVVVTTREVPGGVELMAARYQELQESDRSDRTAWVEQAPGGLMAELKGIKQLIKEQLSSLTWSMDKRRHPMRIRLVQAMLNAGFSPLLARNLAARLPKGLDEQGMNKWLRAVLIRNLAAWPDMDLPWKRGGIWALVGPTGSGKTTTLAKLASRAVDALGAHQVALASMDAYRIGAFEQMRTYADLLGVEAIMIDSPKDLAKELSGLPGSKLVLLDTPGFSPRDERTARLQSQIDAVSANRLLVMTSGMQGALVESTLVAYGGKGLTGCVLSKLDEGGQIGPALDGLIRHRLAVACLASGQRVPEDLYPAHAQLLIDRALRAKQPDVYRMHEEDWPLMTESGDEARRHA